MNELKHMFDSMVIPAAVVVSVAISVRIHASQSLCSSSLAGPFASCLLRHVFCDMGAVVDKWALSSHCDRFTLS